MLTHACLLQGPLAIVRPGVVGADDEIFYIATSAEQFVSAVSTDIVKRPQFAVAGADDENTFITDLQGDVVTDFGEHALVGNILPAAIENLLLFQLEDRFVQIIVARQGEGGFCAVA